MNQMKETICYILYLQVEIIMTILPLYLICLATGFGFEIRENTIFLNVNDVSWTRSTWKIAMTLDLKTYAHFMVTLKNDVNDVLQFVRRVSTKYEDERSKTYLKMLASLEKEVQQLYGIHEELFSLFAKNNYIRTKRGLFNIFGSALQFLTGTATEKDINAVKQSIHKVSETQEILSHVVEDAISILNITRDATIENRNTIQALITAVDNLDDKLSHAINELDEKILRVDNFLQIYLHVDFMVQELREVVLKGSILYDHLQIQLNALSLSHLTPSVIQPFRLAEVLRDIENNLPPLLKLPFDINDNIWQYYRYTSCSGIVDNDQIIVILKLPLLHEYEQFEVYEIMSIPLPMANSSLFEQTDTRVNLMTYQIEGFGLAINKQRTRYAVLNEQELMSCSDRNINYCHIRSAVYNVGLSNSCILHLFLQNNDEISRYCHKQVQTGQKLPMAQYISHGAWVLINTKSLRLALTCPESTVSVEAIKTSPPLDVIRLPQSCSATGDFVNLNAYYQDESSLTIKDEMLSILKDTLNTSSIRMWKEFSERIPHLNKTELPRDLTSIRSIPLESLIDRLQYARKINASKKQGWPNYYYFIIGFSLSILTGIMILIIYKLKSRKLNLLPRARFASIKRWGRGTSMKRVVASHDGEETNDIPLKLLPSAPTTTTNNRMEEYKLLYPNLQNVSEQISTT